MSTITATKPVKCGNTYVSTVKGRYHIAMWRTSLSGPVAPTKTYKLKCQCCGATKESWNFVRLGSLPVDAMNPKRTFLYHLLCDECYQQREERNRQCDLLTPETEDFLRKKFKTSTIEGALSRDIELHITASDFVWAFVMQDGRCALSGDRLDCTDRWKAPSLDRIDSSQPYTLDNIQVLTVFANMMKCNYSQSEVIDFCTRVAKYQHRKRKS